MSPIQGKPLLEKLEDLVALHKSDKSYEQLPGTPYSRFNVPIEYRPSRDYRPRWGTSSPLIEPLVAMFERSEADFKTLLEKMVLASTFMTDVPTEFSSEQLPMPAWQGVPFCPFDGLALYTLIRETRPRRYLEIGSGISTCFAYKAINDGKLGTHITSIDPEPRAEIDNICDVVIRDGLETADLGIFTDLSAGDILFLDGSHRVFMNSDVTVFFIDVLPRIKPGVLIHIHDISLPWDYNEMFANWYWNEQYMLAVYLMAAANDVEVILPTAWACRKLVNEEFVSRLAVKLENDGHWYGGGSMWFKKR